MIKSVPARNSLYPQQEPEGTGKVTNKSKLQYGLIRRPSK